MQRTNIYLDQSQIAALDQIARAEGVTRAEVIRRILDRELRGTSHDLAEDLAAIDASFGVVGAREVRVDREADERMRHLDRIARR